MKQVKILIALLAIVLSSTSAFSAHSKFAVTTYSFISGSKHPANASSWTYTTNPPFCPYSIGQPCTILANPGIGTKPDQNDVTTLSGASSNMAVPTKVGSLELWVKL